MNQLELQTEIESRREVIPPLENGDRLTRDEFERRYNAMPHVKKAELIRGVVHMPSPVRQRQHGSPHFRLINWLGYFAAFTPFVEGGDNSTLRLSDDDVPQPDAFLMIAPENGGKARLDAEGYVVGSPELVAEVAASSVSIDLHDKLDAYVANRIQEYVVWRTQDKAIDWFTLDAGRYKRLDADANGIFRSIVLPGLWLDSRALLASDMQRVFQVVQDGLASPEHATFVEMKGK